MISLRRIGHSAAAFGLLLSLAAAPSAASDSPVQESTSVTAIEIPVNVIGRDGKPVRGLHASDFTLTDDGKAAEISAVEMIDLAAISALDAPPPARRHWLLVFDLTYTSPKGLAQARGAAKDFLARATAESDLVGVATISVETGWKLLANFSRDHAALARAVDAAGTAGFAANADPLSFGFSVPGTGNDVTGAPSSRDKSGARENAQDVQRMVDRGNDARERGRVTQLVSTLGAVARTLDAVRGRKHVLYFSEGFDSRLFEGSDRTRSATGIEQSGASDPSASANEQALHGLTWNVDNDTRFGSSTTRTRLTEALGAFRRSDTVLHAVDVTGLQSQVVDASNARARNGRDALFTMAHETDGELVQNSNELSGELQKVAERTGLVYVLVYQPQKLEKPGAFHALQVKTNVAGARVSARAGYYEPRPYAALSPVERQLSTGDLLIGGGANPLAASLLAAAFPTGGPRALVPVIVELPGIPLVAAASAAPAALGAATASARSAAVSVEPVQIFVYALDANGAVADHCEQDVSLDLAKVRTALEAGGIKYYGTMSLSPGEYTIRAIARAGIAGRAGNVTFALHVPAVPGAPSVATPFFEDPSGRWLFVKKPLTPGQTAPEYPFTIGADVFVPWAAPDLRNGTEISITLVTYNFPGGDAPPPLTLAAEIRDGSGAARPATLRVVGQTRPDRNGGRRLRVAFRPEALAPGAYRLTIGVSETGSRAASAGSARFRIVEGDR